MKILMFNQDWFKPELSKLGYQVVTCGADDHLDIRLPIPLLTYEEVLALAGFIPDKVIFHDNSLPIFIKGLDQINVPIISYAVDVQHHIHRQKNFSLFFDHILVAQKDYVSQFLPNGSDVEWFPLWANREVAASSIKQFDALFVGTMNPKLNPERVKFFDELRSLIPVHCMMGDYWSLFPHAKVVLNQTVRGDLNFRVFEALMCGSILLTEETSNGLLELFTPGIHLETYPRGDAKTAAEKIKFYLNNPSFAEQIGTAGRLVVLNNHCAFHRAERIQQLLNTPLKLQRNFFAIAKNYLDLAIYLDETQRPGSNQSINESIRLIELGIAHKQKLTIELAKDIVTILNISSKIPLNSAEIIASQLSSNYPDFFSVVPTVD